MARRTLDPKASSITVHTRAKGMLSRFAHDLELEASRYDVELDVQEGERWNAELSFDVRGLRVVGVLKGNRVDRAVLSAADREDIERRIVSEHLRTDRVMVHAEGERFDRAEVTVTAARAEQRLSVPLEVERRDAGALAVRATLSLSLSRLGVKEVKGPLGAFKVDDAIEVNVSLVIP